METIRISSCLLLSYWVSGREQGVFLVSSGLGIVSILLNFILVTWHHHLQMLLAVHPQRNHLILTRGLQIFTAVPNGSSIRCCWWNLLLVLWKSFVRSRRICFSSFVLQAFCLYCLAHHVSRSGGGCGLSIVLIKDNIVIVLRHIRFESIVLGHKANQFGAGTVVSEFCRHLSLVLKHCFEKNFPITSSLDFVVHVKVKHTEWLHFYNRTAPIPNEQVFFADFDKANAFVFLNFKENCMVIGRELSKRRYYRWQILGLQKLKYFVLLWRTRSPSCQSPAPSERGPRNCDHDLRACLATRLEAQGRR